MKKIHFLDSYLHNPPHPISISVIGCGGTGSNLLTELARINHSLKALGKPGIHVTAWDDDRVSKANVGRQLFSEAEVGEFKSICLINRLNRFYGFDWEAIPMQYNESSYVGNNITISCVDTTQSRNEIHTLLDNNSETTGPYKCFYWLDCGNTKTGGQVIFGSIGNIKQPEKSKFKCVEKLPHLLDHFPDLSIYEDEKIQGPSCSVAQSLMQQDLFINSIISQYAGQLIWNTLRNGFAVHNGAFINLDSLKSNPINL